MTFKSEIVFVRILGPFLAGIYCANLFASANLIAPTLLFTTVLFSYLIFINLFYKKIKAYNFKVATSTVFYVFSFTVGNLLCLLNNQTLKKDYYAHKNHNYLKVWVNDEPQQANDILRLQVEVIRVYENTKSKYATGKLLIALKLDSIKPIKLNYGDELFITSKYLPVEPSYNPGEFDFKSWLASKNVYQQTFINQNDVVKLNTINGYNVLKHAIQHRKDQVAIYRQLIKDDEAYAVASTLVLGYRADLSKETLAAYSKTGTIHALSVSGAHVAIIFLLLNGLLSILDRKRALKILKLLLICFLIWYYSLLTGFSPSVLRSAIMLTVFILAKAFNRASNNYNVLAFTAFCLLAYNPFLLWDVGFELSFISVFGLIYLQPKIYKWLYVKNKWLDKLWSAIALSLAAQLVTFPLSVYYFHQFPIYFIFGNLFILLPLILMMYLGIAILILKTYFIAPVFEWVITFTNSGLKWIADLPFSGITSIWLNQWQLILLCVSLSILIYALANYNKKLMLTAVSLLIIYQSFAAYYKISASKQSKILFYSLSKNYAVAFIDSRHAVVITDLTVSDNTYQFFVRPALDQMQIEHIDMVKLEKDTVLNAYRKKENQINFHQYKILLIDKSLNYKNIEGQPKFDAVWLNQNPWKKISKLRNEVIFSTLIIDATNKDYIIKKYEDEAKKVNISYQTLKKNKAYLINLK